MASQTKSSRASKRDGKPPPPAWKAKVNFNLCHTHYPVLRQVVRDLGYTIARDGDMDAFVIWFNSSPPAEAIASLKGYQKINHFPATGQISRKDSLARNLNRIQRSLPQEFKFFPKSWVLPAEYSTFKKYCDLHKAKGRPKTFIYKPTNSAQGKNFLYS